MSNTPRHPSRLAQYSEGESFYPRELTELDGILYIIDEDGTSIELNKLENTSVQDSDGTSIGIIDPKNGGTVIIPNAGPSNRGLVMLGSDAAKAAGTAVAGTSPKAARADHVHPVQTTVSGNAGSATKLATARTIGLGGVTATAQSFDGTDNITIPITAVPASIVTGLSAVATSGSYNDLSNKPELSDVATSGNYNDLKNIPTLADVAVSGNYSDLEGAPEIPSASITTPKAPGTASVGSGVAYARADHVHPVQTTVSGNAGSATKLATARTISLSGAVTSSATSFDGSDDISIPVVTIDGSKITGVIPLSSIPKGAQENLIPVQNDDARLALTSTDAQNGDVIKVSDTGIMYYIVDDTKLGTSAAEDAFMVFTAGAASSVEWAGITNKPNFATVATSGSYNDLSNKPELSDVATSGNYNDLSNKPVTATESVSGLTKLYTSTGTGTDGTMTRSAITAALEGKATSSHTHKPSQISLSGYSIGNVDPIARSYFAESRSCKSYGMAAENIKIEYSRDGGETWLDYGATDKQKVDLFSQNRAFTMYLGKSSDKSHTTDYQLRVTIESGERYCRFDSIYHYFGTQGNTAVFDLEYSYYQTPDKFTKLLSNAPLDGWSGPNIHYFNSLAFGRWTGTTTNTVHIIRLTYKMTSVPANPNYPASTISEIKLFGDQVSETPSNKLAAYMLKYDTPYEINKYNSTVTFASGVTVNATKFSGALTGNAGSATKLATARTIGLSGVTATAQSFDGTGNITIPITAVPASIVTGLSTIATSGNYNDLKNIPTFADVATSGSYNDLSNTPTIPSASSATPKASGTANAGSGTDYARADHIHPVQTTVSGNAGSATKLATARTIGLTGVTATAQSFDGSENISIPITAIPASIITGLSTIATSGNYNDLSNKPNLATVATSGSYNDLSNTPTIPSASITTPKVAATTAVVGTSTTYARADHVHPVQTTVSGNAGSATKLATARTINGVSFDGSKDITITAKPEVVVLTSTNLDTCLTPGEYEGRESNLCTNRPVGVDSFSMSVKSINSSSNAVVQELIAGNQNTGKMYVRIFDGSSFIAAWSPIYNAFNPSPHNNITTSADTQSAESPKASQSFTAVDGITRDANGHVTSINTKTITVPRPSFVCGTCSSSGSALSVSISGYELAVGDFISIRFVNGIGAAPTLNINSTGAKYIRRNNANINADLISVGDYAVLFYDGTYYQLVSILPISKSFNVTIGTNWSGSGPYTQSITVNQIKSTDNPIADVVPSGNLETIKQQISEFGKIYSITTASNKITISALEPTTIDIPIILTCPNHRNTI